MLSRTIAPYTSTSDVVENSAEYTEKCRFKKVLESHELDGKIGNLSLANESRKSGNNVLGS